MELALAEAEKALRLQEVPVGCVIVRSSDLRLISRGHNNTVATGNATRHAELEAIDAVLRQLSGDESADTFFESCSLFVTCEPCVMCASALRQVGLRKVYYGCGNDKFGGCGSALSIHTDKAPFPPLDVERGMFATEAVALFRRFYAKDNAHAPLPQKRTPRQIALGTG